MSSDEILARSKASEIGAPDRRIRFAGAFVVLGLGVCSLLILTLFSPWF